MNTEHTAWDSLRARGAAQLSPGFADRVLRAARAERVPLFAAHVLMCAATAAACLVAVAFFDAHLRADAAAQQGSSWSDVAEQASDLDIGL
jgi:hypothetical protein